METKSWQSLILLLFIASQVKCNNWKISTAYNRMIISNATIKNDTDLDSVDFSTVEEVEFNGLSIETFTARLQAPLANIKQLGIFNGNVPKVQVATQFERIYIGSCNTESVKINPDGVYRTVDFAVTKSKLRSLPKNLSAMKNLRELNFHSNLIETVEMAELNGLDLLKEITLSHNQITNVNFFGAVLPKLKYFEVSNNRIKEIRLNNFIAPNFVALNLNDNHLETVDMSEFSSFNLETIHLAYNKIKQITPNTVSLPKLEVLTLGFNELNEMDFQNWNTPSMQVINVEKNQLKKVPGLTAAFPALQELWLFPNPFECNWLNATVKELEARNVAIVKKESMTC